MSPGAVRRILVVDDRADVTGSLALLFSAIGYDVREAHSGAEALAVIAEYDPELVILDIDLGDMTGFDVSRAVRASPERRQAYLVAHTGHDEHQLQTSWVAAGFDQYMRKPLDAAKLAELIEAVNRQLGDG